MASAVGRPAAALLATAGTAALAAMLLRWAQRKRVESDPTPSDQRRAAASVLLDAVEPTGAPAPPVSELALSVLYEVHSCSPSTAEACAVPAAPPPFTDADDTDALSHTSSEDTASSVLSWTTSPASSRAVLLGQMQTPAASSATGGAPPASFHLSALDVVRTPITPSSAPRLRVVGGSPAELPPSQSSATTSVPPSTRKIPWPRGTPPPGRRTVPRQPTGTSSPKSLAATPINTSSTSAQLPSPSMSPSDKGMSAMSDYGQWRSPAASPGVGTNQRAISRRTAANTVTAVRAAKAGAAAAAAEALSREGLIKSSSTLALIIAMERAAATTGMQYESGETPRLDPPMQTPPCDRTTSPLTPRANTLEKLASSRLCLYAGAEAKDLFRLQLGGRLAVVTHPDGGLTPGSATQSPGMASVVSPLPGTLRALALPSTGGSPAHELVSSPDHCILYRRDLQATVMVVRCEEDGVSAGSVDNVADARRRMTSQDNSSDASILGRVPPECLLPATGFCSGRAPAQLAARARKLWNSSSPCLFRALRAHQGSELIITGHGVGGGVAALLYLLIRHESLVPPYRALRVRCLVYGPPAVFAPLTPSTMVAATTPVQHLSQLHSPSCNPPSPNPMSCNTPSPNPMSTASHFSHTSRYGAIGTSDQSFATSSNHDAFDGMSAEDNADFHAALHSAVGEGVTAFVVGQDCFPHLCLDTSRKLHATLGAVCEVVGEDNEANGEAALATVKSSNTPLHTIFRGGVDLDPVQLASAIHVRTAIRKASVALPPSRDAPKLCVPASVVVWVQPNEPGQSNHRNGSGVGTADEDTSTAPFIATVAADPVNGSTHSAFACGALPFASIGLRLSPSMLFDHSLGSYAAALTDVAAAARPRVDTARSIRESRAVNSENNLMSEAGGGRNMRESRSASCPSSHLNLSSTKPSRIATASSPSIDGVRLDELAPGTWDEEEMERRLIAAAIATTPSTN